MTQSNAYQEVIDGAFEALRKEGSDWIDLFDSSDIMAGLSAISSEVEKLIISQIKWDLDNAGPKAGTPSGPPLPLKECPCGALCLTCCQLANFDYAAAIAICNLITTPSIKKQCKANATALYCGIIEACGVA